MSWAVAGAFVSSSSQSCVSHSSASNASARLQELPPTFTTGQALRAGVHPRTLYAWRDDGDVLELSRGVFRRADAPPASYPDLLAVAFRVPLAVVCMIAAARVHDLTDDIPAAVQIAVPRGGPRPRIAYPPVEIFQFDVVTFDLGISSLEAAPAEPIRIYGPERTVVDLMRLRPVRTAIDVLEAS